MSIFAIIVFAFCSWAIFSHKFDDGLLVKHLFIFAAISAFLTIVDPYNVATAISAGACLMLGMIAWVIRHHQVIFHPKRHP